MYNNNRKKLKLEKNVKLSKLKMRNKIGTELKIIK